jgi:hypothetical protein
MRQLATTRFAAAVARPAAGVRSAGLSVPAGRRSRPEPRIVRRRDPEGEKIPTTRSSFLRSGSRMAFSAARRPSDRGCPVGLSGGAFRLHLQGPVRLVRCPRFRGNWSAGFAERNRLYIMYRLAATSFVVVMSPPRWEPVRVDTGLTAAPEPGAGPAARPFVAHSSGHGVRPTSS